MTGGLREDQRRVNKVRITTRTVAIRGKKACRCRYDIEQFMNAKEMWRQCSLCNHTWSFRQVSEEPSKEP